jgi:hypothetical protein
MTQRYFLLTIPLFALLLTCCDSNPVDPSGSTQIHTGTSVDVATQMIPPGGGTISIAGSGDTLDGLTIDVPDGAYSDARNFSISYAPITEHNLGADFTPLTPLIRIANGGGYADEPMAVRIPVKIPAGQCAMVFAYDNASGKLEGLPVISYDSTQITVVTSHLAFGRMSSIAKRADLIDNLDVADLIVIAGAINKLTSADYDSRFRPGVDDWEFENHGSAITERGNCSGQSTTALYYYSTRKPLTGKGLYGRFDTLSGDVTERVWADNVMGLRYASMAQYRQDWNALFTLFQQIGDEVTPLLTYELFALAIAVTHQPQYISIRGEDPILGTVSRHAMIVYRAKGGTLYVADPNFPGNPNRKIDYIALGNQFLPYKSGDNADLLGTDYTHFHYIAQSAIVRWDQLHQMYREMLDGTVGQGVFPDNEIAFEVQDTNGNWIRPGRTLISYSDSIRFRINSPFKVVSVWTGFQVPANVFDNAVRLVPGQQLLGFFVANGADKWLDFKWIKVDRRERTGEGCVGSMTIDGSPITLDQKSSEFLLFENATTPTGYIEFSMQWPSATSATFNNTLVFTPPEHAVGGKFPGKGTYAIDSNSRPLTTVSVDGKSLVCRSGVINITRYDTRIEGNFSFTARDFSNPNAQGIPVNGTLSCRKR